jgi:hypothetical protein
MHWPCPRASAPRSPDELVVEQVGRHPDQLEFSPALAQQLVTGGERDQMGEAFERDAVAIRDQLMHRIAE